MVIFFNYMPNLRDGDNQYAPELQYLLRFFKVSRVIYDSVEPSPILLLSYSKLVILIFYPP